MTLFPDPGAARDLLARELSKPEYQPDLAERIRDWINELLSRFFNSAPSGSVAMQVVLAVLAVVAVAAIAVALSRVRRNHASPVDPDVFDGVRRSAIDHRALAASAYSDGDYDTALIEAVRALTAGLIERGLLSEVPGLTSHETQAAADAHFADYSAALHSTVMAFDEVRYGGIEATKSRARAAIDLEVQISGATPASSGDAPVMAVPR